MSTFSQLMDDGKLFKAFVDQVMQNLTYVPLWKQFMAWEYTPTLTFQSYLAQTKAATMGSVINFGSGKPIRTRPTIGQLTGTLGQVGDVFQMDALTIRKILELEERIARNEQPVSDLFTFLYGDFSKAIIAPHKRLDHWVLSGMSNGVITVDLANNPDGIAFEINLGITTYPVYGGAWSLTTTTHTPLADIRAVMDARRVLGQIPTEMRMSRTTFNKLIKASELGVFSLEMKQNIRTNALNYITVEMMNTYLSAIGLPNIIIVEAPMALPNGTVVYPFADDRIVFTNGTNLGAMQYSYAIEQRAPKTGKSYQTVDNVLVASFENNEGRFLEYELNAFPAFDAYQQMAILQTNVPYSS
jgi:hypothetical protein